MAYSVLEKVLWAAKKNVDSPAVGWSILWVLMFSSLVLWYGLPLVFLASCFWFG